MAQGRSVVGDAEAVAVAHQGSALEGRGPARSFQRSGTAVRGGCNRYKAPEWVSSLVSDYQAAAELKLGNACLNKGRAAAGSPRAMWCKSAEKMRFAAA